MKKYDVTILLPVLNYESLETENPGLAPRSFDDLIDSEAWEKLIRSMPQKYLELLICLYLGLSRQEICQVLEYKSLAVLINNKHDMTNYYKRNKISILGYN